MSMKASDILNFMDVKTSEVEVPEWKTKLRIKELGLEEGMSLFEKFKGIKDGEDITLNARDIAQVVSWGVIDEDGNQLFSEADIPALARKNRNALMTLYTAITALTGEDAEKN
jgi:hypothetical protein